MRVLLLSLVGAISVQAYEAWTLLNLMHRAADCDAVDGQFSRIPHEKQLTQI